MMAVAVLAAVAHRNRTGEGQWIDMSCTEAGLGLTGPDLLDYTVNGRPLRRAGHAGLQPQRPPGHGTPRHLPHRRARSVGRHRVPRRRRLGRIRRGLRRGVGGRSTVHDGRGPGRRSGRARPAGGGVDVWTATATRSPQRFSTAGVPAAAVAMPEDRIDHDPDNAAWGMLPTAHHPEIGDVRVDGLPAHLSETDWHIERGAPLLGQHNREVLGGLLGVSDEELAALAEDGVV